MNVWEKIEKRQFSPLYLVYGPETFFMSELKQKLLQYALNEEEMDFNFSSYDLEETPVELAIEDAETLPFLGERRLVVLHNPVFLKAEKSKEKVEHNLKRLLDYIEKPAPYSIVVFAAPYEKLDERKKITKRLKEKAETFEAKKLNEKETMIWIKERAKAKNKEMDDAAVQQLMTLAGMNLMILASEIDKLAMYATETSVIDAGMVERLTAKSLEQNVFSLVDKIVNGKIEEAFEIYYDLLKQNEEPIKLLSIIASQFRLIYQVKELARKGYGQQKIAAILKVHPFRVKLALEKAQKFTEEDLARIVHLLAECDYAMKTSAMDKKMVIELFLLKFFGRNQK
ncbi:DNA polymerase III subunit delta [Bacillus smithii]|uniref:DNA polymerase III subunit delta n=1 Tax=Bacillus smithii TaxID=1479 RepID=UPI002E1A91D3|nr:DNA polymerase III subunit delta [Bacillus smithii]